MDVLEVSLLLPEKTKTHSHQLVKHVLKWFNYTRLKSVVYTINIPLLNKVKVCLIQMLP